MNTGDFDGVAAFSGGHFMPSQTTQTANPVTSALNKNRETHTLIPLTVKQINTALSLNDDKVNFLIYGVDVNNVKLLGMVLNKTERDTDISFVLDDGTGTIDCTRWIHEPVDKKEMDLYMEGMYVTVHGQLKILQGKKTLTIFGIKHVTDFNEITHHFVECIYVHAYKTKLRKQTHTPGSAVKALTYQTTPSNQLTVHYGAADELVGINKQVFDYLNLPSVIARDDGVHQEEISKQLGIRLDKIMAAVQFLVDDALVYNTIDNHFKSAVNA